MNTQGIGSQNNWAQFVKLTQEARIRNGGLATQKTSSPVKENNASKISPQTVKYQPVVRGMVYAVGEPKVKTVILGGKFDSYA
jgi:hypothetical protein